jgi:hypothetical protein
MLIFQKFIHSWLCYELVKVLYVFGIQPQIRSDISGWPQELHTAFNYLNNKQHKHKETALKVLGILFDKTEHNNKKITNSAAACRTYAILLWCQRDKVHTRMWQYHCIILVTLFLILLYNACFMFQHNKTIYLLISALDHFDLGTNDDTFMSTMSKFTNPALISKQEFHAIINDFAFTQFFTLHSFIYSWALLVCSRCSKNYLN